MGKPYGQKTLGVELGVFNTYGALDGDGLLAGLDGFLDTADVCDGDGWTRPIRWILRNSGCSCTSRMFRVEITQGSRFTITSFDIASI